MSSSSLAAGAGRLGRAAGWFLGVVLRRRTYANLAFLLLALPLGIVYFTVLTTGFTLAVGLLLVLVGAPLLFGVVYLSRWLAVVERRLAGALLGVELRGGDPWPLADGPPPRSTNDLLARTKSVLLARTTWTGLLYLGTKLFVGIVTFVLVVTLLTTAGALLSAPLTYRSAQFGIVVGEPVGFTLELLFEQWGWEVGLSYPVFLDDWQATTLADALALSAVGVVVALCSLHVCNGLARLSGWYARVMLPGRSPA